MAEAYVVQHSSLKHDDARMLQMKQFENGKARVWSLQ